MLNAHLISILLLVDFGNAFTLFILNFTRIECVYLGVGIAYQINNCFQSDPDFCSECGTILPLPLVQKNTVICLACKFEVNVKTFDNLTSEYSIKFDNKKKFRKLKEKDGNKVAEGPMDDRECSKCGHQGMIYTTLQLRSADEGQTVFYSCPNCKHQEFENS
ncbi:DNA-directed RNA polymerase I subunit RPA12 [Trichonephila inaurata madagascariensis]|uniref:DNA-directed RNA polymerase I subunit RPA12 n=1 Tax=Trichonephila inaurata madagascariensis TaxID=2747483 RepID=A0A8X6WQJ5_9ARAC|nr:DNA-directed RNA polymerase I subunit RPA12 [Trichonephila inaurata madagascariensis]